MKNSLIQNGRYCIVCGTEKALHRHHIFYGKNRKLAEQDGAWCYLCYLHHNGSKKGVHFNKELDLHLKRKCEKAWITANNAEISDFIARYGKNYLY